MRRNETLQTIDETLKKYEQGLCTEGNAKQAINEVVDEYFEKDEELLPLEVVVNGKKMVLDGQQRITSIFSIIDGGKDK